MTKLIMLVLLLLGSAGHAFAQWGQCDPLNREHFQTYDSLDYPTLDSICAYPPQPQPVNNCGLLGTAFVTYSDVTVMDDGTVEAFASSEDLSQYSATADVQMDTTVTMPDGSTLYGGGWSPHGFVMVSIPFPVDTPGTISIDSFHELNWPGCDGYGTIVPSHVDFTVVGTQVYDCTNAGGTQPSYGICTFRCSNAQRSGTFNIPLYRIQKACPPPRPTCPATLRASITEVVFLDLDFGIPYVIGDSCIYGGIN
jgi:hypothetical protein